MINPDFRSSCYGTLVLSFLIAASAPRPQNVIDNSIRRIVQLKETLRIKDEGQAFYFKLPWGIDVSPDGSIFVQDGLRLLAFSPDGRFKSDLIKTGQGPGEIATELTDFSVGEGALYLFSAPSTKLLKIDPAGKLLEERTLDKKLFHHLLAVHDRKFFFVDSKPKSAARTEGINENALTMFVMNEDGAIAATPAVFSVQSYYVFRSYGGRSAVSGWSVTRLRFSPQSREVVYVADTPEYLIKQVDLGRAEVTRSFRRDFPRVRYRKSDPRDTRRMPDYENDVHRLLLHNDNLWVLTSDYDPQKGVLVDVFDPEGKFIDSFVLPLTSIRTGDEFSQRYFPLACRGDFLYAVEHDKDWNFSIAKYEIPKSVK